MRLEKNIEIILVKNEGNLLMNCWCDSCELSKTSMLQTPSSCSLKSEYNDLNRDKGKS